MKKVDALFVHANAAAKVYQDLSKDLSAIEQPIWAALLANSARCAGFDVDILDCEAERLDAASSARKIESYRARLIVIVVYGQQPSASTQNMQGVRELLTELSTDTKTLLVGLHPSALPRQTMELEDVDFVCQGEGPRTINPLLACHDLNSMTELSDIPGLWYRNNNEIDFNTPARLIQQKDLSSELPGMAWDLLPMEKYRTSNWHAMSNGGKRTKFASLYTSLGCPFKCNFCCINAPFRDGTGISKINAFRFWNVDDMMSEFDKLHEMGIENVKIADEMFVMNKRHFLELCNSIIDRGYKFNIWAYARIDTVKEEYLETLKKAGVNWLALGIESGNIDVRRDVTKGSFVNTDVRSLVKKIQESGINVIGNYIFGLPEDDIESMRQTLDLSKDLQCEFSNFYCAMAYPGSELYTESSRLGWVLPSSYDGYSQHSYEMRPLDTKKITAEDVVRFRDNAFHEYYEDPAYLKFIESKFGKSARQEIEKMTKIRLRRRILGD